MCVLGLLHVSELQLPVPTDTMGRYFSAVWKITSLPPSEGLLEKMLYGMFTPDSLKVAFLQPNSKFVGLIAHLQSETKCLCNEDILELKFQVDV